MGALSSWHYRRRASKKRKIELTKQYLASHLGATGRDVSSALGIAYWSACHYLTEIRKEWRGFSSRKAG